MTFTQAHAQKLLSAIELLQIATEQLDDFYAMQARLSVAMLRNAAATLVAELNASAVNDFDFALADLRHLTTELPQAQADEIESVLLLIDDTMRSARAQTELSPATRDLMTSLRRKLAERAAAIDRQQYRTPGEPAQSLPHEPADLRSDAAVLQASLSRAGFATPELDRLVSGRGSFYLHDVRQLIEELDVVAG